MTYCEQAPKPAVLLSAIRAIGYSFETAVADIIGTFLTYNILAFVSQPLTGRM